MHERSGTKGTELAINYILSCRGFTIVDGESLMSKEWVPITTRMQPIDKQNRIWLEWEPPDPVWTDMSRKQFFRIAVAIRWMANQMGLRDWVFQLKWESAEGKEYDTYARIEVLNTLKLANIWVCLDFASLDESEQRRCMCHELIHVHLDLSNTIGDQTIQDLVGHSVYQLFAEEAHRAIETATEAMAKEWSKTLEFYPPEEIEIWVRLRDGREMLVLEFLELEG
jgi:hypothetical protein